MKTPPPLHTPIFGDPSASRDSASYAVYCRTQALGCLHSHKVDTEGLSLYLGILQERKLYLKLQREDGLFFKGWTDFCLTLQPYGLGRSPQDIQAIIKEQRDPASIAERAKPLREQGRPKDPRRDPALLAEQVLPLRESQGKKEKGVYSPIKRGSTNAPYLTARIARDRPDVLEAMKAGKYPSVRAAAKAAGIIKERTPIEVLRAAWGKASDEERTIFLAWARQGKAA